jgi:hypothetical protein
LCSSADKSSQLQHAAPQEANEQRLQTPPPLQPQQRLKPLLLPVEPREHLLLLQSVLLEKDRRRIETVMAAGYTLPASSLAFPQYSQPQVQQQAQQRELGGQQQEQQREQQQQQWHPHQLRTQLGPHQSVVAVPVNRPRLLAPQPQH